MYLMHKDDKIAKIELFKEQPMYVTEVYEPDKMPIGLRGDIDLADSNDVDIITPEY